MASTKFLELPCGIEEQGGKIQREIEVKKLKGKIQREIARLQARKRPDAATILDAVLRPSIVSIGNDKPSFNLLRKMHLADRDWLLFELRKHTWGTKVTTKHKCETCGEMMEIENFDLDELLVIRLDDDIPWWNGNDVVNLEGLSADAMDSLKCRVLVIENDELEARGLFRFANGDDQSAISKYGDKPVEAVWKMMSLTCLQWKDPDNEVSKLPKRGLADDFWEEVDMDILDWAQVAFKDGQPGVETEITMICEDGHEQGVLLNATDFFFPKARQRSSKS